MGGWGCVGGWGNIGYLGLGLAFAVNCMWERLSWAVLARHAQSVLFMQFNY